MENSVTVCTAPRRRVHYAFVIVFCCCLMMGVNVAFVFSCAGIFYRPLTSDLGLTVGAFGWYMTFLYIASSLMLPIAGRLLQRYSARMLFTLASLLNGVSLAAMGMMSQLWQFYIVGACLGISISFLLYMSYPTLINRWFQTRMGLMIGICSAASGFGGIIFNPIGAFVIGNYGWRWGYFMFGAIVLIFVTPIIAFLLRDKPEDMGLQKFGQTTSSDKVANGDTEGISFTQATKMPVFYAILIFAFIMTGCSMLNLFIPSFIESGAYSLEDAAMAASATMVGMTLGKLLLGYINDRNCRLGVILCTLGGAAGIMMLVAGLSTLWVVLVGSFLFGWCYAGTTVQTAMLTRTVMGSRDYARIYAIISVALSAGGAFASGGWGWLSDTFGYPVAFMIGAILLTIAFCLGWFSLKQR